MVDLATVKLRREGFDNPVERRSGIIPDKRDTRAPAFEPSASMRTASRGDGGAEELRRVLGMVQKSAEDFQGYTENKFKHEETQNASKGAMDAVNGTVDPELAHRSFGYKNSFALGRTMTGYQAFQQEVAQETEGLIEHQDDPDLGVRQAAVKEHIEKRYREFATDPETGQLKSFIATPDAARWLAQSMIEGRAKLEGASLVRIEQRFKGEALTNTGRLFASQLKTGAVDIAGLRKTLPPTVTDDELRSTLIVTLEGEAEQLKADGHYAEGKRLIDAFLGDGSAAPEVLPVDPDAALASAAPVSRAPSGPLRVSFDSLANAVEFVESRGNSAALSPKGARGAMQTMPGTLRDPGFGVRPAADSSPEEMKRVGRDYLRAMLKRYGGNYPRALAAYNGGPGNVDKWIAINPHANDAAFVASIPFAETREYVGKVLSRAMGKSLGTDGDVDDPTFAPDADPLSPVEEARRTPLVSMGSQLTGGLALRPEERAKLSEYRDQYGRDVTQRWEREVRNRQDDTHNGLLLRSSGLGPPLTPTEIAEKARRRDINPQQARQLLEVVRSDADRDEARAERAENEAERDRDKADEQQAQGIVASLMGPVYSGTRSPGEALRLFSTQASRLDPKVRRAVLGAVTAEANGIEEVRKNNPDLRSATDVLDDNEQEMLRRITAPYRDPRTGRNMNVEQQRAVISLEFQKAKRSLFQKAIDKGDIGKLRGELVQGITTRIRPYVTNKARR